MNYVNDPLPLLLSVTFFVSQFVMINGVAKAGRFVIECCNFADKLDKNRKIGKVYSWMRKVNPSINYIMMPKR